MLTVATYSTVRIMLKMTTSQTCKQIIKAAVFAHYQLNHFRAVARASSFTASGVLHIATTGKVLHNIIVSDDLIGYSYFGTETSLHRDVISFPEIFPTAAAIMAGYENNVANLHTRNSHTHTHTID